MHMEIKFVLPGNYNSVSGGNIYNKKLIEAIYEQLSISDISVIPVLQKKSGIHSVMNRLMNTSRHKFLIIDSLVFPLFITLLETLSQKYTIIPLIHMPVELILKQNKQDLSIKWEPEEGFKYCSNLFVTSEYTKQYYVNKAIPENRITVFPPGRSLVFRKNYYSSKPFTLLNVGNILPEKGQMRLLKALISLKNFSWRLFIAGDYDKNDPYYQKINELIKEHKLQKRVKIQGVLEETKLAELYSSSDLLISVSEFETFGMNIYDAVCGGLPVLASNAGGTLYAVPDKNGILFDPSDDSEPANTLRKLFENESYYDELSMNTKNNLVTPESWAKIAGNFISRLNEL